MLIPLERILVDRVDVNILKIIYTNFCNISGLVSIYFTHESQHFIFLYEYKQLKKYFGCTDAYIQKFKHYIAKKYTAFKGTFNSNTYG